MKNFVTLPNSKADSWFRKSLLVICLSGCLMLLGLNSHPLWGDEAETALFAKNILSSGLPSGWDGTNIMGLNDGIVLNEELVNHRSPWGQYYLAALSFKLFGISTGSARIFFVLTSLLSLIVLFRFTNAIFQDYHIAFLATLLTGLSVPFVLFAYQARYNALTTLASILLSWSLYRLVHNQPKALLMLIFSSLLFFYSHYLSFAAFVTSVVMASLCFKPQIKKYIFNLISSGSIVALASIPWLLWMKPSSGLSSYNFPNFSLQNGGELLLRYLSDFNHNGGTPILLIPVFFWFLKKHYKKPVFRSVLFVTLTCLGYLFLFSLISIQNLKISIFSDIRYAMNIFPLLTILVAYTCMQLLRTNKKLGMIAIFLLISSNVLSFRFPPNLWLWDYIGETTNNEYLVSTEVAVEYLEANSKPGDLAFVTPDYYVEPLQFYLGTKIKFINRITPQNTILERNRDKLPTYISQASEPPTWIILFGLSQNQFDSRPFPANVDPNQYTGIKLPIIAYDLTRPELFQHSFRPITRFGEADALYIYKHTNR